MLRLTTNVTRSPASSARSASAAWRMSSTTSGRVSEKSAVSSSGVSSSPSRARSIVPGATAPSRRRGTNERVLGADDLEHARRLPGLVDVLRVDAQALGEREAVGGEPGAHLGGRRERVLGRDVVAVGAQAAEVGGAGAHQLGPPVGEVRRHLDADVGHQPPRLGDQPLHVGDRDLVGPRGPLVLRRRADPGAPVALGRLGGDLGRLLAVVAAVRDEVLEDDLLDVVEAGERLERGHPVRLGLADADEDAARERDLQLAGGADRRQPLLRVLGRRALVGDQVRVDGLEHQPLRGGHLAQAREVLAAQHAEVGVREQAALERLLAGPRDVAREVLEAELEQALADAGMVVGRLAGEHQQLLGAVAARAVEDPLDLVGLVQVRLVRRERAVLAVAAARPRQRQRQISREGDAAGHPSPPYRGAHRSHARPPGASHRRLRRRRGRRSPERGRHAAARLHAQRGALRHLPRDRARLRRGGGRPARGPAPRRVDRRAQAARRPGASTWRSSTSTTSGWRASRGATSSASTRSCSARSPP